MAPQDDSVFQAYVDALIRDDPPRVWSFIVTIFGDLAQAPGSQISGSVLTRITELAGIKPEAMRVAIHRLRKDGWIDSRKYGRTSTYSLTEYGRTLSAEASPRIYGAAAETPALWHLLIAGNSQDSADKLLELQALSGSYIELGGNTVLGPGPLPDNTAGFFALQGTSLSVPDWLRSQICPPELGTACHQLYTALTQITAHLSDTPANSKLEAATLRALIVHSWRRVVLRHPALPDFFFPPGWPGNKCRSLVQQLLEELPRPDMDLLEQEGQTSIMPPADVTMKD